MTSFTPSRRNILLGTAAVALAGVGPLHANTQAVRESVPADFRIHNKRIRQSVMGWCFNPMPILRLIQHCADIGLEAIEGISSEFYPAAKAADLKISLVSSHGFANGPTDRANHEMCVSKLKSSIDKAVEFGAPSVITFTGMTVKGMPDATAEQNCLDCWKRVIDYAEEKQIALVLEHLNSRDNSHPMKGHPGYFGDDVDRCFDLVHRMDSPQFKLLFDIYHVQVMHGDVIRRIRSHHERIGHYHTAGNPGRGELDENQETNYPAVMRAILDTGYKLFVAQEFIPTWDDPVQSLRHSAMVCDV
ncbi:MAG TPA: TIM barrel protein [Planctomycetaceae bacterium]|nr:TIM barrel protein [Planctomycetaceae bacterium]